MTPSTTDMEGGERPTDSEFYLEQLCELEQDFEDEFFIDCEQDNLEQYYLERSQKVQKVRLMAEVLTGMEDEKGRV